MAKNNYENYTRDQLIDELNKFGKRKKYGLVWEEEKTKEKFEADAEGKLPVLVEDKKREIKIADNTPTHILIEGDNYHALSVLNYTHAKSIDIIYIDPPYNIGNNDFKYNDKFIDREDGYRHSKWLSFMSTRLKLAKNLLKKTGVIFISIDDNEQAPLKMLCDEIFRPENFISTIIWQKKYSPQNDAKYFSDMHDFILVYAKKKNQGVEKDGWVRNMLSRTAEQNARYKNPDNDQRGPWKPADLSVKTYSKDYDYPIKTPSGRIVNPPTGRSWSTSKKNFGNWKKEKRIWFGKNGNNVPSVKIFLSEVQTGIVPTTIWARSEFGDNQEAKQELKQILHRESPFETPKPIRLIEKIIELSTDKDSVVLDFFAGSGTTGQAVLSMNAKTKGNRQFILCNNNESNICSDICYPRIKNVIKGYKNLKGIQIAGLKSNLKYYKTNFVGAEPTHRNKKLLTEKSIEMLCIKENTFEKVVSKKDISIFKNEKKYTAILFDEMRIEDFKNEIKKLKKPISIYVFSLEGDDFKEDFDNLKNDITLCSIPEAILKVYRRTYETANGNTQFRK